MFSTHLVENFCCKSPFHTMPKIWALCSKRSWLFSIRAQIFGKVWKGEMNFKIIFYKKYMFWLKVSNLILYTKIISFTTFQNFNILIKSFFKIKKIIQISTRKFLLTFHHELKSHLPVKYPKTCKLTIK
jgi:hypothetical protein